MSGFDISESMLAILRTKADDLGLGDINSRILIQNLESFVYDRQFATITIPTNTFLMLTTRGALLPSC